MARTYKGVFISKGHLISVEHRREKARKKRLEKQPRFKGQDTKLTRWIEDDDDRSKDSV